MGIDYECNGVGKRVAPVVRRRRGLRRFNQEVDKNETRRQRRYGINLKPGNCLELKDNNNRRRSINERRDGRENESQLCDENAESAICKCMRIGIRCFQPRGRASFIIGPPPSLQTRRDPTERLPRTLLQLLELYFVENSINANDFCKV